jgi:hypothetical protein
MVATPNRSPCVIGVRDEPDMAEFGFRSTAYERAGLLGYGICSSG